MELWLPVEEMPPDNTDVSVFIDSETVAGLQTEMQTRCADLHSQINAIRANLIAALIVAAIIAVAKL